MAKFFAYVMIYRNVPALFGMVDIKLAAVVGMGRSQVFCAPRNHVNVLLQLDRRPCTIGPVKRSGKCVLTLHLT